jgi:hypothetical protein
MGRVARPEWAWSPKIALSECKAIDLHLEFTHELRQAPRLSRRATQIEDPEGFAELDRPRHPTANGKENQRQP